jgi:hypothetical protein
VIKNKTYSEFAYDLFEVHNRQLLNHSVDGIKPLNEFGKLYPKLLKTPEKYIKLQPELTIVLKKIRSHGVKLFVVTDSHIEYLELIFSMTFGK